MPISKEMRCDIIDIKRGIRMVFSNRINDLRQSPIRKLAPLAQAAMKEGHKVHFLNIGQPDIKTPQVFFEATKDFNLDVLKYAPSRGTVELLDSIVSYYKTLDVHLKPNDIIVTNGASEALSFAVSSICNPGDEIMMPEPFYVNTGNVINLLLVGIIPIPTDEKTGYHLPSSDVIEALITPKTKAILLTHPNNPTGTVYTDFELEQIKDIALKHNLYIISDEVYRTITFDSKVATSFGSISESLNQHLILIDSVSKRYSACGARIGALISKNERFIALAMKLAEARLSVSTLDQVGAKALYGIGDAYFKEIALVYEARKHALLEALSKIQGISYSNPEGAFYILVTLPVSDSEHFARWLLESFRYEGETVFVAPAKDFYSKSLQGVKQVRMAYVSEINVLKKAIHVFGKGLETYLRLKE